MKIFLFGGPNHGDRFETDLPFVEGDHVAWTPEQDVSRVAGTDTTSRSGYVINVVQHVDEDGIEHRTAEWKE
jgi:hypothetical protein